MQNENKKLNVVCSVYSEIAQDYMAKIVRRESQINTLKRQLKVNKQVTTSNDNNGIEFFHDQSQNIGSVQISSVNNANKTSYNCIIL